MGNSERDVYTSALNQETATNELYRSRVELDESIIRFCKTAGCVFEKEKSELWTCTLNNTQSSVFTTGQTLVEAALRMFDTLGGKY